ncbi:MAG: 3-hydroxyacyl-ACP dehydratase [Thermodesulfobacteriota bacterium]|jgi:3-hydroxyacyl-[acyl-carrier-protein] dehydratase
MDNLRFAIQSSASGPVKETEPGTFIRSYCFAPEFIGFSGHFPGYPILPAFVQVLIVLDMAEEVKGRRLKILTLEKAKFQMEVLPGKEIEVRFREGIIKGKTGLEATLMIGESPAASFLLTFADEE